MRRLIGALVGMPDYDAYLAHIRAHHPDRAPMTRQEFFRNRQEARYGKGGGGKCC
nr:YbdD/YjiX family protein [Novosphingobium sp. SG707]